MSVSCEWIANGWNVEDDSRLATDGWKNAFRDEQNANRTETLALDKYKVQAIIFHSLIDWLRLRKDVRRLAAELRASTFLRPAVTDAIRFPTSRRTGERDLVDIGVMTSALPVRGARSRC